MPERLKIHASTLTDILTKPEVTASSYHWRIRKKK